MINPPQTVEEVRKLRYGYRREVPFDPERCAYKVWAAFCVEFIQCHRRTGHGPADLYCKLHAKKVSEDEQK